MSHTLTLRSPLFTSWTEQYLKLQLPDVDPGEARSLSINGAPVYFQYTGHSQRGAAEILVKLGFDVDETKELMFDSSDISTTDLEVKDLAMSDSTSIGVPGRELQVGATSPFLGDRKSVV